MIHQAEQDRATRLLFAGLRRGLRRPPVVDVAAWAERERWIGAAESPRPGRWRNATMPYLVRIMQALSPAHPCKTVVFKKSAQVGGTAAGINMIGAIAAQGLGKILVVLPTVDEAKKYNREKLQPAIDATPAMSAAILDIKSRDEKSSTMLLKEFAGGSCRITGANSSAGLQMISVRFLILEEVTEFPFDVEGRGDPVGLAIKRTSAYDENKKVFYNSTPGTKGLCRVDAEFEASDQQRWHVPCPHCGTFQALRFEDMRGRDEPPYGVHFVCRAHGCIIEPMHKAALIAAGRWVKTFPSTDDNPAPPSLIDAADIDRWAEDARSSGFREPGFAIWQAYSPLVSWETTWGEHLKASRSTDPKDQRIFQQQVLGEPFEEAGEALDDTALLERRIAYPPRTLPRGALVVTAAVDVQDNRLEFGAWAWGPAGSWLVDTEVVPGRPDQPETWAELNKVLARKYTDCNGRGWEIEALAIDTGGHFTHHVYMWARRRERTFAIKGVGGPFQPPFGPKKAQDITLGGRTIAGGVLLHFIGTHYLKSALQAGLKATLDSSAVDGEMKPGAVRLPKWIDAGYIRQLTAEVLIRKESAGSVREIWHRQPGRANEALDIRVYAEAMAHALGVFQLTPSQWETLAHNRGHAAGGLQEDLFAHRLVRELAPERPAAPPPIEAEPSPEGERGAPEHDQLAQAAPIPAPPPRPVGPPSPLLPPATRGRGIRGGVVIG